jgi:hypothetical protein
MQTLFNFFSPGTDDVMRALGRSAQDRKLSPLKELESLRSETVGKAVQEKISQALDISLVGIMLRAWKEYGEVKTALHDDPGNSAKTTLVPLLEHTIESSHDPSVSITRGGATLIKISFSVSLEILVEGLILKVQNGRIEEVEAGRFTASGTLSCEGVPLSVQKLQPLNLPGKFLIGAKEQADAEQEPAEPVLQS